MPKITNELRAVASKDDEPWGVITHDELSLMLKFIRDSIREHDASRLKPYDQLSSRHKSLYRKICNEDAIDFTS
jgi:hypothetical protein